MDDPHRWLEEVTGARALEWARQQNARTLERLQADPLFAPILRRSLEILNAGDRIPVPSVRGSQVYNLWRDERHEHGLWRRTSVSSFGSEHPEWQILLDVDALARAEATNWVWSAPEWPSPDIRRVLLRLSVGGADAVVHREFDLDRARFVSDGFFVPESKSRVAWRDADSVFLAPAFDDDQVTASGYPRRMLIWKRGTPMAESELVFEGKHSDVSVAARRVWDRGKHFDVIVRAPEFFRQEYYLLRDGRTQRLEVPADATLIDIIDGQVLIKLKSEWQALRCPEGALVAAPLESLLDGVPHVDVLYAPGERSAVTSVTATATTALVTVLDNVAGKLVCASRNDGAWRVHDVTLPGLGTVEVIAADDSSDRAFVSFMGFLTPTSLYTVDGSDVPPRLVGTEPERFDANGMTVAQQYATSADGTQVPYFVVTPHGITANADSPTLLSAYGGFNIARTPVYSGVLGSAWLERGGVYVLANIRGGGEFGPAWHRAALKENRQRAFDDFIAVAEDLIARGITSSTRLGIQGGSNGGLLVGAAFTQRPDLFGAVVCQVPLLDMRRFHRLLAGASWMAEYGDPDDPAQWAYIGRYSPYHNVQRGARYPEVLFTTSTRDDRVHPGHARKMVARMQEFGHDVLYYENLEGGHGGAADLQQTAFLQALIFTYLHQRLNGAASARAADVDIMS
jgi:prolyl oligopeptidase